MTSLRGARLGSRGLMRSSTVTAAMALMLVDAVLGEGSTKEVGILRPLQGTGHLLPPGLTCWRRPPATHTNWPARTQPKPRAEAWAAESLKSRGEVHLPTLPADLRTLTGARTPMTENINDTRPHYKAVMGCREQPHRLWSQQEQRCDQKSGEI